ncbi:MAG: transglutaminase domain-containing protein [Planctomycetales bacterium]|nr:transglutaminase domain-containing protein [Planctomycetales bacterium]
MKRLAGAGLLVMQLLMFAGSTEGYVAAFALGLAGSTALVVSIGLRRNVPLWLSVPLAALLVWQVRVWGPIRLSPGQSWLNLEFALAGLALQTALLARRPFPRARGVAAAMLTLAMLSTLDFQIYTDFSIGYGLLSVLCLLAMLADPADSSGRDSAGSPLGRRGRGRRSRAASSQGRRWSWLSPQRVVTLNMVAVLVVGGVLTSTAVSSQMPKVRQWIFNRLQIDVRMRAHQRHVGFSVDGWIGAIADTKSRDPMTPVLQIYADQLPGYLRGRAFDRFVQGNRWLPVASRQVLTPVERSSDEGVSQLRLFRLQDAGDQRDEERQRMRVVREVGRSSLYFLPLRTEFLETVGRTIQVDTHQAVQRSERTPAYTAYLLRKVPRSPLPEDPSLLEVPEWLDPRVRALAMRIGGNATSDGDKIARVLQHLRSGDYSLDSFRAPQGVDALSYFLLEQPASHCEFYASGAAMLLRHLGVRCRYVVGYLVTELEDDDQEYWQARHRDAHAWVEAYDRSVARWVVVDATPGSGIDEAAAASTLNDAVGRTAEEASEQINPWLVYFATLLKQPFTWVALLTCCAAVLRRYWLSGVGGDLIARQLHWLGRKLRRHGLTRSPSETLHQFARRIKASGAGDPWLERAAQWHLDYAAVRYGGDSPEQLSDPRTWPRR